MQTTWQTRQRPLDGTSRFRTLGRGLRTAFCLAAVAGGTTLAAMAQAFNVTNILSDGAVPATTVDANFINPWGVSASPNWWISAAGSGYNYVVPVAGTVSFKVIVPLGATPTLNGLPSGAVTAAGSTGLLLPNGTAPSFLFSTLDGTISGWNGKLGTNGAISQIVINNSGSGASYAGLALLNTGSASFLLAPNFTTGAVEVYDSSYKAAKLAGSFSDPNLPANYAPFSVHILGTQVFVAYAQRTTATPFRSVVAPGAGILDVFDTAGNLVSRAVTGGNLNAPWGVAIAPASFGIYSNDLLVGNFGDGKINVYDPKTFSYIGQLMDSTGKSLSYASLWELLPGGTKVTGTASVSAGDVSTVYFTAGLTNEAHGLFGAIANTSVAGSTPTFNFTGGAGSVTIKAGTSATIPISVAPANGFSGTVTLACSGLAVGASCNFSPSSLSVSSTAATTGRVTIGTTGATASLDRTRGELSAVAVACLLPFASLLGFRDRRRRRAFLTRGGLFVATLMLGSLALVTGCGGASAPAATPAGQSNVVITATSGALTQQTAIALTVQ